MFFLPLVDVGSFRVGSKTPAGGFVLGDKLEDGVDSEGNGVMSWGWFDDVGVCSLLITIDNGVLSALLECTGRAGEANLVTVSTSLDNLGHSSRMGGLSASTAAGTAGSVAGTIGGGAGGLEVVFGLGDSGGRDLLTSGDFRPDFGASASFRILVFG